MNSRLLPAALPFLCGLATGILITLLLLEKPTGTFDDMESALLAEQISEMKSLIGSFTGTLEQRERDIDEATARLEMSLSSLTLQRSRINASPDGKTSNQLGNAEDADAEFTASLPRSIREALTTRNLSPKDSPEILKAVIKAAEELRLTGKKSADAIRSMRVPFEEREPTRNRIRAIRDEQWKSTLEVLGYVLDDYLKNR